MSTCLIVDDSLVSRMMLSEILKSRFPDVEVVQASSGDDALSKVETRDQVRLAILDFNMPGMDGLQLAEALQKTGKVENMALLTANVQDSVRERAEGLGLTFINKPIQETVVGDFAARFL